MTRRQSEPPRPEVRAVPGWPKSARKRAAQSFAGHRPMSEWGSGDLPGPWAEGDILTIPPGTVVPADLAAAIGRYEDDLGPLGDPAGHQFVVTYATSIDEGDAWYTRVMADTGQRSDRLHTIGLRSNHVDQGGKAHDDTQPFVLVDTLDLDGQQLRQEMLGDEGGWAFSPTPRCPTCGQECRDPVTVERMTAAAGDAARAAD